MEEKCFFECTNSSTIFITCGAIRVDSIRSSSIKRGDGLVHRLDGVDSIRCHKSCVSTYTSTHHISRYVSKQKGGNIKNEEVIPAKKICRSGSSCFIFKEHCLFCGERCIPLASCSKHPDRWRKVVQCQTADDFKQKILNVCDIRNDSQAEEVRVRVNGAVSDLHAADGQYHDDCYKKFINLKNITSKHTPEAVDSAFDSLITEMVSNQSHLWNSIEIYDTYVNYGGVTLSRPKLIDGLVNHFGEDLLVLSGNGVASVIVFRSKAPQMLKLVDDNTDINLKPIAKIIKKECTDMEIDRDHYETRLVSEDIQEACSDHLLMLLAELSPKLDHTNTALLIGNIVTSVLTNSATTLQITLGTTLREKSLIELCSEFGITCSYDEVLRFKKSIPYAAATEKDV